MKKVILGVLAATMLVTSAPAYAWNASHCNTAPSLTRSQKGQLLKNCIGKFSHAKYVSTMDSYREMNRNVLKGTDAKAKARVTGVLEKASIAINDINQKWVDEHQQNAIDTTKDVAIIAGITTAAFATLFAAVATTPAATAVVTGVPGYVAVN